MSEFKVVSEYNPAGGQPHAIEQLTQGVLNGEREQTLLGVTGSGKTFTIANVIANVQRPTLVLAHNKTLAAQLCSEFKEFFPDSAVEYFVSYYDYFRPEAYMPSTDVYIEKDLEINAEIERLRHSATSALFERRDVIIVSSVSCIFSLGDPEEYMNLVLSLRVGMQRDRDEVIRRLLELQYSRNDIDLVRGSFRVRGDVVEIIPVYTEQNAMRIEFFGDEIERISEVNIVTGEILRTMTHLAVYPGSHYVASTDKLQNALKEIEDEALDREKWFLERDKYIEAQRVRERAFADIEMIREIGFCKGIENYSRVISGREVGSTPYTLIDYFPKDFLLVVDESHVTLPQIRGMSGGDRARKENLVDYGFRLPSAFDNRPLLFREFDDKLNQIIYVSATPSEYERSRSNRVVEQVIRPTGLIDPILHVRPTKGQIDDLVSEINERTEKGERVLVTTLTKKMAEDLTDYLEGLDIKVRYMHHDIETIERMKLVRSLRLGEFDVLVGINLLREGLDLPEVSLVAILDADKEGFLRSGTSLVQIIGRAARNVEGTVIMYADKTTDSMEYALSETERRRDIQIGYNKEHGITPKSIVKKVSELLEISSKSDLLDKPAASMSKPERMTLVEQLKKEMKAAAKLLEFEHAAYLRDRIGELERAK